MGVASLPTYNMPETHGASDALWAGIARRLRHEGVDDVPSALVHGVPVNELWRDPALFFSQCCGFDVVKSYTRVLRPIATPCFDVPGCDGCQYSSIVIVNADAPAATLADIRGGVCAVNGPESHSGMNALRAMVAPISEGRRFFANVIETGAHVESIALVAGGGADVAAIDCVTYALIARYRPALLARTRVLCKTDSAPGQPYVTRTNIDNETVRRMQAALRHAFDDPALADARAALLIAGIEFPAPDTYYAIVDFERHAVQHGYPKLQ